MAARHETLSNRTVAALAVDRDTVFWDRNLTGFGVRVYPSGGKVYIAQARERTGEKLPKRVTIGRHDMLNAEEARRRAALIIARIRAGEEPLPLPPMAVELLEALPRRKGSPWVFPGNDRHRRYSGGGLDHAWQIRRTTSTVWVWAVLPDDKADIRTRIAIRDLVFDFIPARNGIGQAGRRISSSERNRSCPSLR